MTITPVLSHPDFSKIVILYTGAIFDAIRAVLSQKTDNGKETIIAYGSKSMNKHEIGCCITRKELLSIFCHRTAPIASKLASVSRIMLIVR